MNHILCDSFSLDLSLDSDPCHVLSPAKCRKVVSIVFIICVNNFNLFVHASYTVAPLQLRMANDQTFEETLETIGEVQTEEKLWVCMCWWQQQANWSDWLEDSDCFCELRLYTRQLSTKGCCKIRRKKEKERQYFGLCVRKNIVLYVLTSLPLSLSPSNSLSLSHPSLFVSQTLLKVHDICPSFDQLFS